MSEMISRTMHTCKPNKHIITNHRRLNSSLAHFIKHLPGAIDAIPPQPPLHNNVIRNMIRPEPELAAPVKHASCFLVTPVSNKRVEQAIEAVKRGGSPGAIEGGDGEEEAERLAGERVEGEVADEGGEEGVRAGDAVGADEEEEAVELGEEAGAREAVEEGGAGRVGGGGGGGEEAAEGGGRVAGGEGFEGLVGGGGLFPARGRPAGRFWEGVPAEAGPDLLGAGEHFMIWEI